jgi:multimeric flavodoxin WrbA
MKTLIFNGSLNAHGDTEALIAAFTAPLRGEVKVVSWRDGISPCVDCRACHTKPGCSIDDAMQGVYAYLADCHNVVLASPIWFSSLSGPLLNMTSRLQMLWAGGFFRKEETTLREKEGVLLLAGAEPGTDVSPTATARAIMKTLNVRREAIIKVTALHSNELHASQDVDAMRTAHAAALEINRRFAHQGRSRT